VAVKVICVGDISPNALPRILKRFRIEAKKMANLTHPNIVDVKDYGEYKGVPYFVMPYLPGGTLKGKLGRPMPWQDAVKILLPIADALQYAHEEELMHREIKPGNILVSVFQ
jgi:serine/threonine-protein kinase